VSGDGGELRPDNGGTAVRSYGKLRRFANRRAPINQITSAIAAHPAYSHHGLPWYPV